MNGSLMRILSLALVLCYLAACASSVSTQPLNVRTAADMRELPIKGDRIYVVRFDDGAEVKVVGNSLFLEKDALCIYSSAVGQWTRYNRTQIDEVYLENTDQVKKRKKTALITGAAVLAAFAAAAAGGYFIERELQ